MNVHVPHTAGERRDGGSAGDEREENGMDDTDGCEGGDQDEKKGEGLRRSSSSTSPLPSASAKCWSRRKEEGRRNKEVCEQSMRAKKGERILMITHVFQASRHINNMHSVLFENIVRNVASKGE